MSKEIHTLETNQDIRTAELMEGYPGNPDGLFISFAPLWLLIQNAENKRVPAGSVLTLSYDPITSTVKAKIIWEEDAS